MQAHVGNMPTAMEAEEKIDQQQSQNSKTCSCSVSRLLDGTNAEQLNLMKAEFARHGGRLDLQEPLQQPVEAESALFQKNVASASHSSVGSDVVDEKHDSVDPSADEFADQAILSRAALMAEAFEAVDVNDEGFIRWEHVGHFCTIHSIQLNSASCVQKEVVCQVNSVSGSIVDMCYVDTYGKIALAGYDGSIHMMTTNGLMLTEKLSYKHQPPSCLEWMSGPNKLLSGCVDGTVQLWDLVTFSEICSKKAHNDFVTQLLHTPDEGVFISASADTTLKIWDVQMLECKHVLKGHSRSVTSIAHSKEYNCLISAGLDQERRVMGILAQFALFLLTIIEVTSFAGSAAGVISVWRLHNSEQRHSWEIFGYGTLVRSRNGLCWNPLSPSLLLKLMKVSGQQLIAKMTFRRGVMAPRRRTFLTQPASEWTGQTEEEQHESSALRKRRDGTKVARPKKRFLEVTLVRESSGHDDAVLALDLCEAGVSANATPAEDGSTSEAEGHLRWILTVGADRVVKAWSLDLRRLGQLTSDAAGFWTPLGNKSMERRRSFLRAAGLNLTALRQRMAEKFPKKQDEFESDSPDVDGSEIVAPARYPGNDNDALISTLLESTKAESF
ncbi:uncharacterized protein EMH_0017350 [Eimeria mitis]|uniref:Uncharacterized protein n=1 Tax=Eimeria mitis TaxID=44415 RepID=U6JXI8_9EIME|nr:uncharacterized protein EMH_0017350 [Eimeria mitis]CDJ28767.1 hypothetical protein, conserved [Eimeria mitis]